MPPIDLTVPYVSGTTAYDNNDKVIKSFKEGADPTENHFANFIKAVRSRKREDQTAEILEGHLSSALCHTSNISFRLGEEAKPADIHDEMKSNKAAMDTWARFVEHLETNGVSVSEKNAVLGPMLEMDPKTERFKGNDKANELLTREYRKGFEVPATF